MKINIVLILISILISSIGCSQTANKINNQKTFAKLFGYIRYFHPGDEASDIDWNKFAVYGCSIVDKCNGSKELKEELINLFLPIAPAIKIFETGENIQFNPAEITPENISEFKTISWQHFGVDFGIDNENNIYSSERTNRPLRKKSSATDDKVAHDTLFDKYAAFGEYINKEIGSGLSCIVPIALYGNVEYTYPESDTEKLNALKKDIWSLPDTSLTGNNLYLRLADVIITWNIFQHFYPYFDFAQTNWGDDLTIALTDAYNDTSEVDFLHTLQRLTAKLKDGHIRVRNESIVQNNYYLPLDWEWIENKLVITSIFSDSMPVHIGDIVTHIDGITAEEYFKTIEPRISAATKGWMKHRADIESLTGYLNSEANLKLINEDGIKKNISIKRSLGFKDYYQKTITAKPEKIKRSRMTFIILISAELPILQ
ncbi:MAG: hypothetical protein IPL53_22590 [Ignavibacteria bacterium]|nr:hypothetical protein [Ignavibacteria bacterium]